MDFLVNHLRYYDLSIVDCGNKKYCLYDLKHHECYEKMSLEYILSLVKMWETHRKIMDNYVKVVL